MKLSVIINYIKPQEVIGHDEILDNIEIDGVSHNSKTAKSGDIFVCLKGEHVDGHDFAKSAFENGVRVFLVERPLDIDAVQIVVGSTALKIADLSNVFYGEPSKELEMVGVTGTNGKTTVTHLVQKIVEANDEKCALIGTLGHKLSSSGEYLEAKHTTPLAPELQHTLRTIADKGIKTVAMEVSSHALSQNRVGGCVFKGAVFTNLTQDHLDYHVTMQNYFEAKAMLFARLKEKGFAVINNDDERAGELVKKPVPSVKILTYGIKNKSDVMAKNIRFSKSGAEFLCVTPFGEKDVKLHMNGMFSVYNALAALGAGLSMGISLDVAIGALEKTKSVDGRFEIVHNSPMVIVDYAHTPDGLENVLRAARELTPKSAELICVFGCGGDRDATKRPKMGKIADTLADKVIVTSDNPRSEDPSLIISDILTGIQTVNPQKLFVEPDRKIAISLLKKLAKPDDVVVVAGKGHEDYQILKDETIHFDDREEVRAVFA